MTKTSLKGISLVVMAGAALITGLAAPASAAEHSLIGIHIYSNVRSVLLKYGNPTFVLTAGQSATSGSGTGAVVEGVGNQSAFGGALSALPPLQPSGGGPVQAFGMGGDNAASPESPESSATASNGEVTLVYQEKDGVTYQFLLSPSGSVVQITALGYYDPSVRTTHNISFGSTLPEVEDKYGYPENTTETNGVVILNYSGRAHVAFELVNNLVVGIVVAAVD